MAFYTVPLFSVLTAASTTTFSTVILLLLMSVLVFLMNFYDLLEIMVNLQWLFNSLGRGYLERDDFFAIPEIVVNPLGDRIIDAFFDEVYVSLLLLFSNL